MADRQYYNSLPAKRMGAGALFFAEDGRLLLVKPTYKPVWEIPGGVVEENESPRACCQREVAEELGLPLSIGRLLVVDYNPARGVKTESLMFIFAGGILTTEERAAITLPAEELSTFQFFSIENLPEALSPTLRRRIMRAWKQWGSGDGVYLEQGE